MALNFQQLKDEYDQLQAAVTEVLEVLEDDRYKLSGKIAKIEEILEPFTEEEE